MRGFSYKVKETVKEIGLNYKYLKDLKVLK